MSDRAPYPGLRSFRREETDLFFGREDCVEAMIERLGATRFLAVLGSSGTGKSSLVKTGLLAGLEMGLLDGAGSRWWVVDFRPQGEPLRNLARGLLEVRRAAAGEPAAEIGDIAVNLLRARLGRSSRALIEWCREGHLAPGTNLLLLVDQFEELFRYEDYTGREEAEAFVSLLLESRHPTESATAPGAELPIYVTLTMRSEYLGACALVEGLAEAINEGAYLTPRMTRDQCRDAIVGPARVCGIEIEPKLVNKLLNDLAAFAPWDEGSKDRADRAGSRDQLSRLARRADQLPIMQHALNQLWRETRAQGNAASAAGQPVILTLEHYESVGEVTGALNQHADGILKQLDAAQLAAAEAIFRALTSGTTVANAVRRPTRFAELVKICGGDDATVRDVLNVFRSPDCNFLLPELDRTPELDGDTLVDITHESLIRQWKTLSSWLEKEGRAGHDWQRLGEDAERGEPLAGQRLANAIALREASPLTTAGAERYGVDLARINALIDDSIALRDETERREEQRRAAELRRARMSVYGVLGVLVVVAGLAGYALYQKNQADQAVIGLEQAKAKAEETNRKLAAAISRTEETNRELAAAKVRVEATNSELAAAIARAEEKTREVSFALQDLGGEIRSSRTAALNQADDIADLALTVAERASPLAALDARNQRYNALSDMGDFTGALAELDKVLAVAPDNVRALASRAYLYLIVGKPTEAIKDIEKRAQILPGDVSSYDNLVIAKIALGDYDGAIAAAKAAIAGYAPPVTPSDIQVSPDVEKATGHTQITLHDYEYRVALSYLLAICYAYRGGDGFEAALKAADDANLGQRDMQETRARALDVYLAPLNWAWLGSIWQKADSSGIHDYGLYAAEGALWERVGAVQPRYFAWALESYRKFQQAYAQRPEARYDRMAKWVAAELERKELVAAAKQAPQAGNPSDQESYQDLALRARELKAKDQKTSPMSISEARRLIGRAIAVLDKQIVAKGDDRQDLKDAMVSLLLDRAQWNLDAEDVKGARDDAQRIVDKLNPNVSAAYWLLARTDTDDKARIEHYEHAIQLNPRNSQALWDYAELISGSDPQRALALHQQRLKSVYLQSSGYEKIAGLQLRLGQKEAALKSIEAAISITPFRERLFELRRDIEIALGVGEKKATAHLAAGYRRIGDFYNQSGEIAYALSYYVLSLKTVNLADRGDDEDLGFELEATVRALSSSVSSRFSTRDAQQFWRSLAASGVTANMRERVRREVARLSSGN